MRRILPAVLLARGALLLLAQLAIHPAAIITNDWVAGLTAPYARHTAWAGSAASTIAPLWQNRRACFTRGRRLCTQLARRIADGGGGGGA